MRTADHVTCIYFPCNDVKHECFTIPGIELDPAKVSIVVISEAAPQSAADRYYAGGISLFERTTLQAFQDAGVEVDSFQDLIGSGIYFTSAVKCAKTGYAIVKDTVRECSHLLEDELSLYPNVCAYLLMGDVAIQAVNHIARRAGDERVIPPGSTYKVRKGKFYFHGVRAFPSYLQAGPSFFIEKSKRRMIAEDIAAAMELCNEN